MWGWVIRRRDEARDAGHEAVGQALLICGMAAGVLTAASLADAVLPALEHLTAAFTPLP